MATEQAATMPMPPPSSSSSSTSNDFFNYIVIYDTISACTTPQYDETYSFFYPPPLQPPPPPPIAQPPPPPPPSPPPSARKEARRGGGRSSSTTGGGGSKKRRRKARVCKNKEEAETQRMTHIAVERNRRKLMNEHLALLKSLMPPSYVQRGDQASIVAGATEFVKELEHLLHSLQAQKLQLANQNPTETATPFPDFFNHTTTTNKNHHHGHHSSNTAAILTTSASPSSSSYNNNEETMNSNSSSGSMSNCGDNGNVADVEVTLIETHANLRILLRRNKEGKKTAPLQLSKLVCGFHALGLGVLHFSLNTVHPFALYSVSAKVEEGCQLSSVEDIAAAVHHMLRLIVDQEEENLLQQHY